MADKLVTEQVEVDPVPVAATFRAAECLAVEAARLGDVAHLHGHVKGRQFHGTLKPRDEKLQCPLGA